MTIFTIFVKTMLIIITIIVISTVTKIVNNVMHLENPLLSLGKSLIELCFIYGVHTLNWRLFDDIVGNVTCLTKDGASVVNSHIVSSKVCPFISFFNIDLKDESDHSPLCSKLRFTKQVGYWVSTVHVQNVRLKISKRLEIQMNDTYMYKDGFVNNLTNACNGNAIKILFIQIFILRLIK